MDCIADLPSNILEISIPDKSYERYKICYETFINWKELNGFTSFGEEVLLAYFNEASNKYKSSTMWTMYSMLKSTIHSNHNINISTYSRLTDFLKEKSIGFESQKSKVFSAEEINKFLVEAPDEHYLAMKTVLVFGVAGGCRGNEITNVKIGDVRDYGTEIIVHIPQSETKDPKIFPISGEFAKIVQKYMQLRPANVSTDRFFIQYQQGECKGQVIGKNKVANMPKEIAKFLNLDAYESYTGHSYRRSSAESYTGHSYRRSSAPILAYSGANIETMKSHGQFKSTKVAEGYIQEPLGHKRKIDAAITDTINLSSSSNALNDSHVSKRMATFTITSTENSLDSLLSSDSIVENVTVMSQPQEPVSNVEFSQREETGSHVPVSPNMKVNRDDIHTTFHFHNCSNITINFMN